MRDPVVVEFERAISAAAGSGDNDRAQELSIELAQYKELYQLPGTSEDAR